MTDDELIGHLIASEVFGLTLFGEARNQGEDGIHAVADVVRNRVRLKRFGAGYRGVCLRPWAFSCWKAAGGASNHALVMDAARSLVRGTTGPLLRGCLDIAQDTMNGAHPDSVNGSTHYCTEALWRTDPPAWAIGKTPTCRIGAHVFFAGVA